MSLVAALAAMLLTTCAGPRGEARPVPAERRAFPVLDEGALSLDIPVGWHVRVLELEAGTPASIRLDPPGGGALFITPLFDPEGENVLEAAALFTELARRKALDSAGGVEVPTAVLRGPAGEAIGYWFVATDLAFVKPGPGQEKWRNMLRGARSAGRLLVTFTWFDDAAGPARDQVLALVRGARHETASAATPPPAPAEGGPGTFELTPDPGALTVPLAVREPGGAFTVLVDLPGFQLYAPRPSPGGDGYLVLGQHPETGIVVSVTIGPAGAAQDGRTCRDGKLARLRRSVSDLSEVGTSEAGEVPRLFYVLKELRGREIRQEHAHAFLLRDGRCVDVHASMADPDAADAGRLEAILRSVRFASVL